MIKLLNYVFLGLDTEIFIRVVLDTSFTADK